MDVVLMCTALVALAEMGDKTQLLAAALTVRFRKPWPILGGILVATVFNHLLAAAVGAHAGAWLDSPWTRRLLGLSFLAFAIWTLFPDKDEDVDHEPKWGAFATTAVLFFLAEMGDKTQLATVALGARYQQIVAVTAGTTLGMMIADGLAVFVGEQLALRIPLGVIRRIAAAAFAILGLVTLLTA